MGTYCAQRPPNTTPVTTLVLVTILTVFTGTTHPNLSRWTPTPTSNNLSAAATRASQQSQRARYLNGSCRPRPYFRRTRANTAADEAGPARYTHPHSPASTERGSSLNCSTATGVVLSYFPDSHLVSEHRQAALSRFTSTHLKLFLDSRDLFTKFSSWWRQGTIDNNQRGHRW